MDIEEKKKKEYKYFVSYFLHKDKHDQRWGRAIMTRDKKIKSSQDLKEIEDEITKDNKGQVTILMNYILM